MKLFLCGGGSGSHVADAYKEFLRQVDNNKPLLYVPLAMDETKYKDCKEWFTNEIKYIGLSNFEMVYSAQEFYNKNLRNYCAIFIGGGNTYDLLNKIDSNNLRKKLVEFLLNGGIVFGGSAGAIIFGQDIDVCKLEDGNNCGLRNTEGFNYANDLSILCHLNQKHLLINIEHLKKLSYKQKIIYLPEEDVVFINHEKIQTFGGKDYILVTKGRCYSKKFKNLKKEFIKKSVKFGKL